MARNMSGTLFPKIKRLFTIKTRFEAIAVIYALALGSVDRGLHYVEQFPGFFGWVMFAACTGVIFMVGGKLMDMTRADSGERRRRSDWVQAAQAGPSESDLKRA